MKFTDANSKTIAITDTLLTGPNPRRRAIVFGSGPTNRYTVSFGGAAVLDQGINVPPNTIALVIDYERFG